MPVTVTIDHVHKVVRQQGSDPILYPADAFAVLDQQAEAGAWAYATIADLSHVQTTPTAHELRVCLDHIAKLSRRHGQRGPVAVVVPDNLALYGMYRMYSMVSDDTFVTQAFKSLDEAEDWLRGLTR